MIVLGDRDGFIASGNGGDNNGGGGISLSLTQISVVKRSGRDGLRQQRQALATVEIIHDTAKDSKLLERDNKEQWRRRMRDEERKRKETDGMRSRVRLKRTTLPRLPLPTSLLHLGLPYL